MKEPLRHRPMRVAFFTLGCKVNQYETDCLSQWFQLSGWETVSFKQEADLYLVNTCTVTAEAQRQSLQMTRHAVGRHPQARVGALGCACQLFPEVFQHIPGLDFIVGNFNKMEALPLIAEMEKQERPHLLEDAGPRTLTPQFPLPRERTRAFLRIQEGCDAACSYCLVPKARGPSRSLPEEEVGQGVDFLERMGVREVVLTGIHLGQYGMDLSPRRGLAELLKGILSRHPDLRIRLSSLEPQEVTGELIELFNEFPNLCRHLHIPLQSGDDRILQMMNRNYSIAFYKELIEGLRRGIPDVSIGADLIVGFPGEGDDSFSTTLRLVSSLPLSYLHLFPFSPRPGTPAAGFPGQVPQTVKKERLRILREVDRRKRKEFMVRCLGKTFTAVGLEPAARDGWSRVLSGNYLTVFVPEKVSRNERVRVRLTGLEGERIRGNIVERG